MGSYWFRFGLGRFRLVSGLVRRMSLEIHKLCTTVNDELAFLCSASFAPLHVN